ARDFARLQAEGAAVHSLQRPAKHDCSVATDANDCSAFVTGKRSETLLARVRPNGHILRVCSNSPVMIGLEVRNDSGAKEVSASAVSVFNRIDSDLLSSQRL